jgi:hypothetical protein
MGLPCAHQMQERLKDNETLTVDDIHPHWHFTPRTPFAIVPLTLEPTTAEVCVYPISQSERVWKTPTKRATRVRLATATSSHEGILQHLNLWIGQPHWSVPSLEVDFEAALEVAGCSIAEESSFDFFSGARGTLVCNLPTEMGPTNVC